MANLNRYKNGVWRIRLRFGGRSFFRSLETTNKTTALAMKAAIEETIALVKRGRLELPADATSDDAWRFFRSSGRVLAEPKLATAATLKEVADQYFAAIPEGAKEDSTLQGEHIHVKHFRRVWGDGLPFASLDRATLQRYVDKRSKSVQTPTILKEFRTLAQVWNVARSDGLVKGDLPKSQVRFPKTIARPPFETWKEIERTVSRGGRTEKEQADLWECLFLTEAEILELLNYIEKNAKHPFALPMFAFTCFTGARRSEIIRSEVSDFRLDDGFVLIREKKRKRSVKLSYRQVQLNSRLCEIMRKWFSTHPGGRYTICQAANVSRSKFKEDEPTPLTKDRATHHFKKTLAGSKWEVIKGFHTLRHSFASICAMRGVPETTIDAWMGHQTEEMRERYRHLYPDQQQAAMAKLFTAADLFNE